MEKTKYSKLVESAKQKSTRSLRTKVLDSAVLTKAFRFPPLLETVARELERANQHITVDAKLFNEAREDYEEIGKHLVERLNWSQHAITVSPQGSSNTQTLIKSPFNEKFDIDAVCAVDISRVEANDPMAFFQKIGDALSDWDTSRKKRCWRIDFANRRHYIEFTPSVPYSQLQGIANVRRRFSPTRYHESALAVVDTPTGEWKASNPQGFSDWIDDQAKRPIIEYLLVKATADFASANVNPVPDQEVPLTDILRIAIRLLKRHRDMCVHRGHIDNDLKPISVIIVTLLTQCYEGLADERATYTDPIELFADLAELMPGMIEVINGKHWISNPTVDGENFAEKWNDNFKLKETFDTWCELLVDDLNKILSAKDEQSVRNEIHKIFGTGASSGSIPPSTGGLTNKPPTRVHNPPERGLA